MGIALVYYQAAQPYTAIRNSAIPDFGYPYYMISFSLNVILTLMIITRLVLHTRNIRNALGTSGGALGLHKAIITMLVESAALYAVTFLLFIGTWGPSNPAQFIFLPALAEVQVCIIFTSQFTPVFRYRLTRAKIRLSPRSSSFYESPTREH